MKGLHILQVVNRVPWPLNDGGNIATYNVTRFLHRAGHRVELACLNTLKHHQDPRSLTEATAVHTVDIDTTVTISGAAKGLLTRIPYNVKRFLSQEFSDKLQSILREGDFDLVQLEGSYMSLYAATIRHATKAPIVLRSHNVEFQIWERLAANEGNVFKRTYLQSLTKKIRAWELDHLQDYDAIIPIASQDAEFYRNQGFKGPIRTINGGVDLETFHVTEEISHNYKVAFLGSLEWMPNVQGLHWFLNEIWPQLRSLEPRLELHVAGKNPSEELKALKVNGMIFHGEVHDAASFMESCHFFVVPLLSGGGMRLKVVEAMAMGRCVISTTIGAEGIDCKIGEEILLADDPADWVTVFQGLLADSANSVSIAQAGMVAARQRFSLAAVGAAFEEFYKEVLR